LKKSFYIYERELLIQLKDSRTKEEWSNIYCQVFPDLNLEEFFMESEEPKNPRHSAPLKNRDGNFERKGSERGDFGRRGSEKESNFTSRVNHPPKDVEVSNKCSMNITASGSTPIWELKTYDEYVKNYKHQLEQFRGSNKTQKMSQCSLEDKLKSILMDGSKMKSTEEEVPKASEEKSLTCVTQSATQSSDQKGISKEKAEQAHRAELRLRHLLFLKAIQGKEVEFYMYCGSRLSGKFISSQVNSESPNILVDDLMTPMGKIDHAALRFHDIVRIRVKMDCLPGIPHHLTPEILSELERFGREKNDGATSK